MPDGQSWTRVLDLVRHVDGDVYVSGAGGLRYLDHDAFESNGIEVRYMTYNVRPWFGDESSFIPYLSGLDLLAETGAEAGKYLRPSSVYWADYAADRASDG